MKNIVLYKSKYGSSKKYAVWIAEGLGCKAEEFCGQSLSDCNTIIYVGGLYAGQINGFAKFAKRLGELRDKRVILCIVGSANPENAELYKKYFCDNVPEQHRDSVEYFALRGDLLYSKMSLLHRVMMKMPKAMAEKVTPEKRTEDDVFFIENYGKDSVFASHEAADEIIKNIKIPS